MLHVLTFLLTSVCLVGAQIDECPVEKCTDVRCELKHSEKAIDVILLIDGSESISRENFTKSLEWALITIDGFEPRNRTEGLKVLLVQYSSNATLEINKDIIDSSEEIKSDVDNINQMKSGTKTYQALEFVNNVVFPNTRESAFKILITMTDGDPTDTRKPEAIRKAKEIFNVMVAVGVGNVNSDKLQDFAHRVEPINVTDYDSLRVTNIFNIVVNSTYTDCMELRTWCGPSTKSTLNVSYCICNPSSNVNTSLIQNYQLEISPNGTGKNPISQAASSMSALFDGLDPYTNYMITVNATLSKPNVVALPNNTNCYTKGCIIINPMCGNSSETTLHVSYSLELRGIRDISSFVKEFRVEISPGGTSQNTYTKTPNERTASFTGLSKGTAYTITITAITFDGAAVEVDPAYINCNTTVCPHECEPMSTRLVFLIDGSESISPALFSESLQWVLSTVNKFRAKDSRELRVTAVQYSNDARMEIENQLIESSAEEIRGRIESIVHIREGTNPFAGLRFINDNVNLAKSFYNVLITLADGRWEQDIVDTTAVNTAANNYKVMLAVGLGEERNMTNLLSFVKESTPFPIEDTSTLDNNVDNITKKAHQDCIKFNGECDCDDTDTRVLLRYTTQLFGSISNEDEVITNYAVTITPGGTTNEVELGSMSTSFTGLSPYTSYNLTIDGVKIPDKCVVVVPKSVTCSTRAVIQPTVSCGASTDTALGVTFDPRSSGFGDDFSVIQGFVAEISLGGALQGSVAKSVGDRTASFTGLSPSTEYTITVYPIKTPGVCAANDSHSVACSTKATTEVSVNCENNSTRDSVTVTFSSSTTHPDGIRERIQSYRLSLSPGGITEDKSVDDEQHTFPRLSPSTTYTITINAILKDGVDDVVTPSSVNCTTKGLILIDVRCKNSTDHSLTVEYSLDQDLSSVVDTYTIEIVPPGTGTNTLTHRNNERIALFSGLAPSTPYLITVSATTIIGADYEVEPDSVSCSTKEEVCRDRPIDLVFLIDGSESIDQNNFREGLNWASETVNRFNKDGRTETLRVAAVQYSDRPQREFDRIIQATGAINTNVANINQIRSSTQTFSGLQYITSDVTPNARNRSCSILIIMSDGDSTEPRDQSAVSSIKVDYDVIIAVGYTEPIIYESQLQDLSTVGKPFSIQNSASISNIVTEALETCCRKETTLRVDIVVSCETTTNSMIVSHHPIPIITGINSSLIQSYQIKITAGGEENSIVNAVNETIATFSGLYARTTYVIEVTGNIVDGADIEVMPTYLNCMTKDPCTSSPCQNGASCQIDGRSDYKCNCRSGWTGINCEIALIKPVVECVFSTEDTIVAAYSVLPPERGYDSSLISSYIVEISPTGSGTSSLTKSVGVMTATFSQLSQSTNYTVTVNVITTDGANVNVEAGSATCKTKTVIRPIVTCPSRTNDTLTVSYSTGVTDLSLIQGFNVGNGMSVIRTSPAEDTAVLSGLPECTEYMITVDVEVNPSRTGDVILEQGSAICRTDDGRLPPAYDIVDTNSSELVINIDAVSCATGYTTVYTRFNCDTSVTETRTITETTFSIPRLDDTERYSITIYTHYVISGLSEGTTRNVSVLSGDTCGCSDLLTTTATMQPTDDCRVPVITLAVLLAVAVVIAIILAIVLLRRGRNASYDLTGDATD